jgi:hypothetical protein
MNEKDRLKKLEMIRNSISQVEAEDEATLETRSNEAMTT